MGNKDDHLQSINECPACASGNIVHSTMRDQIICKDCGLVFEPFEPIEARPAGVVDVKRVARKTAKKAGPRKAKPKKKPKCRKPKTRGARPAKKARRKRKPSKKKWTWW